MLHIEGMRVTAAGLVRDDHRPALDVCCRLSQDSARESTGTDLTSDHPAELAVEALPRKTRLEDVDGIARREQPQPSAAQRVSCRE